MIDIATETLVLLAAVAFVAGVIDSIAGGGGMLTIPALLLAGVPPVEALGTNKLQGLFGSGSATLAYASKGHIDLKSQYPSAFVAFAGSVVGAVIATILPGDLLRIVLPFFLIAIALYFALKPNLDDIDRARRIGPFAMGFVVVPLIGFYDGLFGPGTGSFLMLAFVALAGYGVLKATAHTKLLNFGSNVGGFLAFWVAGAVIWKVGLAMGVAQFLGARLGAAIAMRVGSRIIKPLLVVTSCLLAIRLLADETNPIRVWLAG